MEQLANLLVDALFDPAVLMPAIAVSAALLSGLAARMVEICEDHLPRRRFRLRRRTRGQSPKRLGQAADLIPLAESGNARSRILAAIAADG
jgi:hypothetical protein